MYVYNTSGLRPHACLSEMHVCACVCVCARVCVRVRVRVRVCVCLISQCYLRYMYCQLTLLLNCTTTYYNSSLDVINGIQSIRYKVLATNEASILTGTKPRLTTHPVSRWTPPVSCVYESLHLLIASLTDRFSY